MALQVKKDYSDSPHNVLCPPILGLEEAVIELNHNLGLGGAGRTGTELRVLWKSNSSCGQTKGRGHRCDGKGLRGREGTKGPRPQRSLRHQRENVAGERKLGNWEGRELGSQSKVLDGLEKATGGRKKDPGSEVPRSWVPSGGNE